MCLRNKNGAYLVQSVYYPFVIPYSFLFLIQGTLALILTHQSKNTRNIGTKRELMFYKIPYNLLLCFQSLLEKRPESPVPMSSFELWGARNNIDIFLRWCRSVGVKKECMFEVDGLGKEKVFFSFIVSHFCSTPQGLQKHQVHFPQNVYLVF